MSQSQQQDGVVYEDQTTDISWYNQPLPEGTARNNFDRIIQLRKEFCHPLTILSDGSLNKRYFANTTKETAMNWSDIETLQLYEGIYKHGIDSIDKWHGIQSDFLPQRDFIEVRLKLSQLFGTQDLAQYKGRKFDSEQQIQDEFDKNKAEGMSSGTWSEQCQMCLLPSVASLTEKDERMQEKKEMDAWLKYVYHNPHYVYRTNAKVSGDPDVAKSNKNNHNKNKKSKKKVKFAKDQPTQKNTIDAMLKKQATEKNQANQDQEIKDEDENGNEQQRMEVEVEPEEQKEEIVDDGKKQVKKKKMEEEKQEKKSKEKVTKVEKKAANVAKSNKKKQKMVPLIPEDSEDEEMLCVE